MNEEANSHNNVIAESTLEREKELSLLAVDIAKMILSHHVTYREAETILDSIGRQIENAILTTF